MQKTSTFPAPPFSAFGRPLQHTERLKMVVLFVLGIALLGGNWPVMKLGLNHISPIWFATVRFISGCVCLLLLQAFSGHLALPKRRDFPIIASVGLIQMMMFTALGAIAMLSVSAGRSAILGYTTPLWVTPMAMFLFKERFSPRQLAGTIVGFTGILIMLNPGEINWQDSQTVQGNALLLFCSLCWAVCILHIRHHQTDASAYQLAPWQMLLASVCLLPLAYWIEGDFTGDPSPTFWWVMLYVGPLATAFSFVAINAAGRWLSSASMSNAMLGVPVIGLFTSTVFLGEPLSPSLLIGGVVILGGIVCVTWKSTKGA